ncbi:uncharacterized protein [Bemisia tabaci]|uniref:uncharacterized protein isoform X2 n=1 Tax=Bemisia tabaci TaxID=7038 RepID=UPI0008F994CF|nr:PREDICTED: uncharacterized protein LOC109037548 isoform X2 [Bemisia tabaci]
MVEQLSLSSKKSSRLNHSSTGDRKYSMSDRNSQIRMYISRTVNYGIRLTPVQTRLWTSIDRLIVPSAVFLASIGITVSTFSVKQLLAAGSRTKRF